MNNSVSNFTPAPGSPSPQPYGGEYAPKVFSPQAPYPQGQHQAPQGGYQPQQGPYPPAPRSSFNKGPLYVWIAVVAVLVLLLAFFLWRSSSTSVSPAPTPSISSPAPVPPSSTLTPKPTSPLPKPKTLTSASKSPTAKSSSPSPSQTGHDGIDNRTAVFIEKSCSITAKLNSSHPINVVFVDEIQIGETRSNGDQQYNVKGHAFEGKTKYEVRCTVFHVKDGDLWKTENSSIGTDPID